MTLLEQQSYLMQLANTHLRAIPWGVAYRLACAAFEAALPGDEPLGERSGRALAASNAVWREHLTKAGVSADVLELATNN